MSFVENYEQDANRLKSKRFCREPSYFFSCDDIVARKMSKRDWLSQLANLSEVMYKQVDKTILCLLVLAKNCSKFLLARLKINSFIFCFSLLVIAGAFFTPISLLGVNRLHLLEKLEQSPPKWIRNQIDNDLSPSYERGISVNEINAVYAAQNPFNYLVKFTIANNKVSIEYKHSDCQSRAEIFHKQLSLLCSLVKMPDTVFLMSIHDAFNLSLSIPVFAMALKKPYDFNILIPDFDAITAGYQVISPKNIVAFEIPWNNKKDSLIWRGSTAQASIYGHGEIRLDNIYDFSRVLLCEYSRKHPEIIDAGFTFYAQGAENIPFLQIYNKSKISFSDQLLYKYHILVDGNTCPYSASGWKFFTNSLIFKPQSNNVQWYYSFLQPYEHYIPVENDLSDLMEKLEWAKEHDYQASIIANNARQFAISNLTVEDNIAYWYHLIMAYTLHLVD